MCLERYKLFLCWMEILFLLDRIFILKSLGTFGLFIAFFISTLATVPTPNPY